MRGYNVRRNGFTVVELLVVVSIIVLLISILLPSMSQAREATRRAVCASNLHQWGAGILAYASDNATRTPETLTKFGGRYPQLFNVAKGNGQYISYEAMDPYLYGVDPNAKVIKKVWTCPSFEGDHAELSQLDWNSFQFINTQYAYFGGVSVWTNKTSKANLLFDRLNTSASSTVMMSDQIYRWGVSLGWDYNHGLNRTSSVHKSDLGNYVHIGPPEMTGANQLTTDGAVHWKDRPEFDPEKMDQAPYTYPADVLWVRGGGRDMTYF